MVEQPGLSSMIEFIIGLLIGMSLSGLVTGFFYIKLVKPLFDAFENFGDSF